MRATKTIALAAVVSVCLVAAAPGAPSSVASDDGILLELWLDRATAVIGERVTARVRATNASDQPIYRMVNVGGGACSSGAGMGVDVVEGHSAEIDRRPAYGEFTSPGGWPACPALAFPEPFEPGWVGETQLFWTVDAPTTVIGQLLTVRATFRYERDIGDDLAYIQWRTVETEATFTVVAKEAEGRLLERRRDGHHR
jgi:hypothetical protein